MVDRHFALWKYMSLRHFLLVYFFPVLLLWYLRFWVSKIKSNARQHCWFIDNLFERMLNILTFYKMLFNFWFNMNFNEFYFSTWIYIFKCSFYILNLFEFFFSNVWAKQNIHHYFFFLYDNQIFEEHWNISEWKIREEKNFPLQAFQFCSYFSKQNGVTLCMLYVKMLCIASVLYEVRDFATA